MLAITFGLYAAYVLALSALVPSFIYPFSTAPWSDPDYKIIGVRAPDGLDLPVGVHDAGQGSRTILVFVGNAGTRLAFSALWDPIEGPAATIVIAPWRGAEGLPGPKNEADFKKDARAIYDALPALLGRDAGPVDILAYSLGTGLALDLAAERNVARLLLIAPYARLCDVMQARSWAPACWLPWVDRWDSEALVHNINAEVTVLHGFDDEVIPFSQGERLAQLIGRSGRLSAFKAMPRAGHNDILWLTETNEVLRRWSRDEKPKD